MRKFVVHTRAIPNHKFTGVPMVLEVEGEIVNAMEDSSVMWLSQGEFKFRITAPESLYELKENSQSNPSKKEMIPPVYYSHAIYHTLHEAVIHAERVIKSSLEFEVRKKQRESFTDGELKKLFSQIQIIMLLEDSILPMKFNLY